MADNEAHIGYYDGSNNWNYISWVDHDSDLKNITVLCNADWGATYLDELLEILNSIQFDKENQTGGIGIYEPSSELGIDEGYLSVSAKNISSTSATLVFNYLTESDCGGHMEPVSVWVRNKGEWAIIHRCKMCGAFSSNRVAADDNPMKLMSIAMKPIGHPPFPLERIEEMTRLMGGQGSLK